ncbi:MAG: hypothetical protein R3B13_38870 [Polyangiaceae bacterium]
MTGAAHDGADAAEGLTELDLATLRLLVVALDAGGAMLLAEHPQAEPGVLEAAERYWRAFTRGWSRKRHARVFLLQCIDQVDAGSAVVHAFTRLAREKLDGRGPATPLDSLIEMFATGPLRGDFHASVQQEKFSRADAIRVTYSRAYPVEARRLSDEQLDAATREWRRKGGHRRSKKAPHKWQFFAKLFNDIGLGPVTAKALEGQWQEWRKSEHKHLSRVFGSGGASGAGRTARSRSKRAHAKTRTSGA